MSEPYDVDQDILDATFKLGEICGLLSRHRKSHPERVADVTMMARKTLLRRPLTPEPEYTPPMASVEQTIELLAENHGLKATLSCLLHDPSDTQAQEAARKALGQP